MEILILLTIFQYVLIALGAGSAYITDLFFLASKAHSGFSQREQKMARQLNLISIVGSFGILLVQLFLYCIVSTFSSDLQSTEIYANYSLIVVILSVLAFIANVSFRKIHFTNLIRHQQAHIHLSDFHIFHSKEIVSNVAFSTVTWTFLLIVLASAQYGFVLEIPIFVIYYILSFLFFMYLTRLVKFTLLKTKIK